VSDPAGTGVLLQFDVSLGTQAALVANDVPDTRSWATLPARIGIGRVVLPPGKHDVEVVLGPDHRKQSIEIAPGGYAVVCVTDLR